MIHLADVNLNICRVSNYIMLVNEKLMKNIISSISVKQIIPTLKK